MSDIDVVSQGSWRHPDAQVVLYGTVLADVELESAFDRLSFESTVGEPAVSWDDQLPALVVEPVKVSNGKK